MEIKIYINDHAELEIFGEFHGKLEAYRVKRQAELDAEWNKGIVGSIAPTEATLEEIAKESSEPVPVEVIVAPAVVTEVKAAAKKRAAKPAAEALAAELASSEIPTLEETKEAIQAFANARSVPEATEMLALHGATKLKDLAEDKRAPLIAAMKAAQEGR